MDELTKAYLAGVMDSDGWFTIKRHASNSRYGQSFTYSESAGCGQTTPQAVELLQASFGGVVKVRTRKTTGNWKPMHYWAVTNMIAADVAATLRPYLRVKAVHADLIIGLRASKDSTEDNVRIPSIELRGRCLRPEVVAARHAAYERIRSLNDRRVRV
jgi:ABC-type dipeptide/oligopeptide/nickel transport system ATPase subunit